MYASQDGSLYAENTQTVANALSHKHTITGTIPDLEAGAITLIDFLTSFLVVAGDEILAFSSEFPNGLKDIAGTVVDNLDGTWTVPFTAVLTVIPTTVHRDLTATTAPIVATQSEQVAERIVTATETLTFVSATDIEFVGTSSRAGMLEVGDTINISDGVTPTPVVLTSMVETGTAAPYTYTCGYATAIVATINAYIPPRTVTQANISISRKNAPLASGGNEFTIVTGTLVNDGTKVWNAIGRSITANIGWTIDEPFTMDYTEKIV